MSSVIGSLTASSRSYAERAKNGRPRANTIKTHRAKTAWPGPARNAKPMRHENIAGGVKLQRDNHLNTQYTKLRRPGLDYLFRMFLSQPFFPLEVGDHHSGYYNHNQPDRRIAPSPLQLRHVLEIHAVYARHKGKRDKYRGNNCQHFHD